MFCIALKCFVAFFQRENSERCSELFFWQQRALFWKRPFFDTSEEGKLGFGRISVVSFLLEISWNLPVLNAPNTKKKQRVREGPGENNPFKPTSLHLFLFPQIRNHLYSLISLLCIFGGLGGGVRKQVWGKCSQNSLLFEVLCYLKYSAIWITIWLPQFLALFCLLEVCTSLLSVFCIFCLGCVYVFVYSIFGGMSLSLEWRA